MTTKGPSQKQIIIPMSGNNSQKIMTTSEEHIANQNCGLKDIKSDIVIDFIWTNHRGLIITKKVASSLDLSVVSNYFKGVKIVNVNDVQLAQLLQFKSYLKTLDTSYINEDMPISSSSVENIIKSTHIFNNIKVISKH